MSQSNFSNWRALTIILFFYFEKRTAPSRFISLFWCKSLFTSALPELSQNTCNPMKMLIQNKNVFLRRKPHINFLATEFRKHTRRELFNMSPQTRPIPIIVPESSNNLNSRGPTLVMTPCNIYHDAFHFHVKPKTSTQSLHNLTASHRVQIRIV